MMKKSFSLQQENDLQLVVEFLLSSFQVPFVLLLDGDLGAGKTTFVRYLLAKLNSSNKITSPTFGKVHQYDFEEGLVYHLDLYRELPSPMLLEEILLDEQAIVCIEWASRLEEDKTLQELIHSVNCSVIKLLFTSKSPSERLIELEHN